ncbi:MAG TPA: helix-turn-helix domain-containing protein [Candidatus Thermoplasmatota archaeon]|nr:helix-turn-helix domain-containing protein [Candidatus Thermoplasmatota archaeon]
MPINGQRVEKLREYGLTEYEARAYLALLDLGSATAHDAARVSRVPRTKIYAVLDDLHGKQLAEIIPERPKRYQPVPFHEYLEAVERAQRARLARIESDKGFFGGQGAKPRAVAVDRAGTFHVLKGRRNVAQKQNEMLGRAHREILATGSQWAGIRLAHSLPALREKAAAGVAVRVLCPVEPRNLDPLSAVAEVGVVRHPPESARLPQAGPASILLIDDREAIVCHHVPDDEHIFQGEDVAMWTDDSAIVAELRGLLEERWDRSEEFSVRVEALSGTLLAPADAEAPAARREARQ